MTETQGSNPWNIYGDRAAPIFIWYEKSRLRRARGRPEKYTPVISLYLRPIRSSVAPSHPRHPTPMRSPHPALFIQRASRPPSRVFVRFYVRFPLSLSLFSRASSEGKTTASFTAEKVPFIFARRIRRVFERRQRDMLMPVGAMKSWAMESRISIKAIEGPARGPLLQFFCLPHDFLSIPSPFSSLSVTLPIFLSLECYLNVSRMKMIRLRAASNW